MERIKVLHYLRHLGLGGTEKTCQLFFEHANRYEFEVAVAYEATGTHPRIDEFTKGANVCGGHLFEIDSYDGVSSNKPNNRDLSAVIESFKPDILHVYRSGYQEFPEPAYDIDVPHFVETNVFGFYDSNIRIDRSLFMSKWLMNNTLQKLRPISRALLPKRFDFVNNPVEMPYTNDKLTIPNWNGGIVLGRVGRPDNGIYNSIHVEAARLLRLMGHDVKFLVVAPPSNMVEDLLNKEIPFHIVEPTVNPLILSMAYNTMDIYAHARADGETFGVNIAEAMIHGLPVVTHIATPSFPGMGVFQSQTELVDQGETGFIVNNDPVEYAEVLRAIIINKEERKRMGEAGRRKAEAEYEVSACMNKLEKIYREVVT